MGDSINFKVKDIMDKLTTEELVFELQKRRKGINTNSISVYFRKDGI